MRGKPPRSRARSDAPRPSFMQTLQGLRQLHVLGLCHRDFSLENALLSSAPAPAWLGGGLTAKIIDLGACEALPALPGQLLPRAWPIRGEAREGVRLWCSRGCGSVAREGVALMLERAYDSGAREGTLWGTATCVCCPNHSRSGKGGLLRARDVPPGGL